MADNYLQFSEVIPHLSPEETAWLRDQLKIVHVFGGKEYTKGEIPKQLDVADAEWAGCRAFRDMEGYDPELWPAAGFRHEFRSDRE